MRDLQKEVAEQLQMYYLESAEVICHNVTIFTARLLVRHDEDGKMYLYDILRTKKETSKPLEQ